jgi:pimeloyl-ACP methyl ester carboxylesterase/lysophospholipase L1-like esterase
MKNMKIKLNVWIASMVIALPFTTQAEIPTNAALDSVSESVHKSSDSVWSGSKSSFHGFDQYNFKFEGVDCKVVVPKKIADGKPWVWRARFWGHQPQFDIAMLKRGYHIVYCPVGNMFGNPAAVKRWDAFYDYLRFEHLFSDKPILEGMSRGGLIIYNWAAANPDKVQAIYGDAPVMDFKSWPGGNGQGKGSAKDWRVCLKAYGFTEAQALAYTGNPLDNLALLAKAKIPILHVVGDADDIVPVAENTAIAEARYKQLGGQFEVIHKPGVGHHPHSLKNPKPIVDFMLKLDKGQGALSAEELVGDQNFTLRGDYRNSRIQFEKNKRGHVAFIGGSITEMNGYRPIVCEMLKQRFPETKFNFTQAGISSTCSDTGAFRLQRDVLSKGPLDMLFVEFAVNDDQDGDQGYNDALRGMEGIIAQARRHNPNVDIVMTFFANENILSLSQRGQMAPSVKAHSQVAEHYGVSVNHLAQELADQIAAGKTDWETYGGVHPKKYGNTMCGTMIANALLKEWAKPLSADAEPRACLIKKPFDEKSYIHGRFVPFADVKTDASWQVGVPDWKKENKGMVRKPFLNSPMIYSSKAHAKLTIKFTGTAIGAYMLAGPDAGVIRCTIDGTQTKEIDTLCKFSGFNYPVTILFFNELENGDHTLELEILKNRPGRMKAGGTALRVIGFTAN